MSEILYFGCLREAGHYLHSRRSSDLRYNSTAWGNNLDCALLNQHDGGGAEGVMHFAKLGGWSMIQFWDRSGDSRPGSNSAFLCAEELNPDELLKLACEQWPQVFARFRFQLSWNRLGEDGFPT